MASGKSSRQEWHLHGCGVKRQVQRSAAAARRVDSWSTSATTGWLIVHCALAHRVSAQGCVNMCSLFLMCDPLPQADVVYNSVINSKFSSSCHCLAYLAICVASAHGDAACMHAIWTCMLPASCKCARGSVINMISPHVWYHTSRVQRILHQPPFLWLPGTFGGGTGTLLLSS